MKRTYVDANVLIAAFRGEKLSAMQVLDDPDRILVVSDYLRLEVMPKPTFYNQQLEIEFMQGIFEHAENVSSSPELTSQAIVFAARYDINPLDALHVSAAFVANVDELVTMEKPTKPLCNVQEVSVLSLSIPG